METIATLKRHPNVLSPALVQRSVHFREADWPTVQD